MLRSVTYSGRWDFSKFPPRTDSSYWRHPIVVFLTVIFSLTAVCCIGSHVHDSPTRRWNRSQSWTLVQFVDAACAGRLRVWQSAGSRRYVYLYIYLVPLRLGLIWLSRLWRGAASWMSRGWATWAGGRWCPGREVKGNVFRAATCSNKIQPV